jgi:hypothetical protein
LSTAVDTTPRLVFEPETHVYRLGGRRVLSVTQVLTAAGLIDAEWFTEESRTRGSYVHKMIMYDEREGLDERSVDERLAGYLAAYRAFVRDLSPGPCMLLEQPLADPVLRYAGTPDQLRLRPMRGRLALIDHKSGAPFPWHRLQTAAYAYLIREHAPLWNIEKEIVPPLARYCLYLRPNGQYRLEEHSDRNDWKLFQAALAIAQFKEAT